jgi:hypothetical protein
MRYVQPFSGHDLTNLMHILMLLEWNRDKRVLYVVVQLWFTSMPPILTLELSRFQYNQHLNEPEKIHARLEFPEVLYMDR